MRQAGEIAARTLAMLEAEIAPGVSTAHLDRCAEEFITDHGCRPSFKGYMGFPASICASVNDAVVHGIPDAHTVMQEGWVVGIDLGVNKEGWHADIAATFPVGEIDAEKQRLLQVTRQALELAVQQAVVGNLLSNISRAVQQHVERAGFSVVRDLVGHGVGRAIHEEPRIPNFVDPATEQGLRLQEGMTLAIEPMVNAGDYRVRVAPDRWTVLTADGKPSAHFEHTVAVRREGPWVLTALEDALPATCGASARSGEESSRRS